MPKESDGSPLNRFFVGLSEYVFHAQLGVADTQVVDYISQLLIRFSRFEGLQKVRLPNGEPATQIVSMVSEAEQRIGEARREVHRHIGDFTLFWSGLYPEALRSSRSGNTNDAFLTYCEHGKKAYRIASTIESDERVASNELLSRLSAQFEMCAYGLREIRREWEKRDDQGENDLPLLF